MDWNARLGEIPHIGEIFALSAPICWSIAVILFRKTGLVVPAAALNLYKNLVSFVLLGATLLILGQWAPEGVTWKDYGLLILSGAIGMGFSDTAFFLCLNRLGAQLQAVVNTSYSPSMIALGVLFLGERLSGVQGLGVAFILCAVLSVVWLGGARGRARPAALVTGILLGLLTTTSQAASVVIVKGPLEEWPLIWATWWRLIGGLVFSLLLLPILPEPKKALATLKQIRVWRVMLPGSVMGSYFSLLFWMAAFQYTQMSTAAALNQTATLFIFVLAAIFLKEPVTPRRVAALVLGAGGVALVTFGG